MLLLVLIFLALQGASTGVSETPVVVMATPAPVDETDVRKAASKAGYGEIASQLVRATRPVVLMQRDAPGSRMPSGLGTSRLGGDPDLPEGARWPRCKGAPQSFLGQVRVRDLPTSARDLRRHGGVLLFFMSVEFEPGEKEFGLWGGDCSAVVHAPKRAQLRRNLSPRSVMRLKPARLRFTARPDLPDLVADHLAPPLEEVAPPGGWEPWYEFRYALNGRPELEHRLLGYGAEPNGGNDCSARAERSTRTWRHLATFGYDEDLGFMVADGGRQQMYISPEDLRRGRFDRVCGIFDSG